MDGRRSGREQDRNQGDKKGGSDEAIHVEKYCVGAEKQSYLCLPVGVFRRLWAIAEAERRNPC